MVALAGRGWRLAPCLVSLVAEADAIAPRRSTRSDGSIGDQSHRNRASDHNPSGGYVHAVDLTHDPARGFDAHERARMLARNKDARIKYIISNRMIWSRVRGWRRYSGANPHTLHSHVSVHSWARHLKGSWWFHKTPSVPKKAPTTAPKAELIEGDDMQETILNHNGHLFSARGPYITHLDAAGAKYAKFFGAKEWTVDRSQLWAVVAKSKPLNAHTRSLLATLCKVDTGQINPV